MLLLLFLFVVASTTFWVSTAATTATSTTSTSSSSSSSSSSFFVPASQLAEAPYADWAHVHMVWWHNSVHNQTNSPQLVRDYLNRNVRVGWFNTDSTWDAADPGRQGVGTYAWDPSRYPDPQGMINELKYELGVRLTNWQTSVINTESPNWQIGCDNGYFLNGCATVDWWRGVGSFIDYNNPEGLEWYHGLMRGILEMGIDGWKCDGADPYIFVLRPKPVMSYTGPIDITEYAEAFYGDFYNYSNIVNGDKTALIMARPVDFLVSSPLVFAPNYVMFSGWVGDQPGDFSGIREALTFMLHSGNRNFTNFGSDIAGYQGGQYKESLVRWAQMAAFCPFMENGGVGEHRPWMFGEDALDIYRVFVDVHYSLFSYLLTTGTEAYASYGTEYAFSAIRPVAEIELDVVPSSWNYFLGSDIFVAPMTNETYERYVEFPAGDDYVYWFNESIVYSGGSAVDIAVPFEEFPAFRRAGALIPMDYEYGSTFINTHSVIHPVDLTPITLQVNQPRRGSGDRCAYTPTHGTAMEAEYRRSEDGRQLIFTVSAFETREIVLRIVDTTTSFVSARISVNDEVVVASAGVNAFAKMARPSYTLGNIGDMWGRGGVNTPAGYRDDVAAENVLTLLLGRPALGAVIVIDL